MSRRKSSVKRAIKPDRKYNSMLVSILINGIMKNGKRSLAERIVYSALSDLYKLKQDMLVGAVSQENAGFGDEKTSFEEVMNDSDSESSSGTGTGSVSYNDVTGLLFLLDKIINNVRPYVEVKSRRVGGSNYQVPIEVPYNRGVSVAIKWIARFANERTDCYGIKNRLCAELADAVANKGGAVKKKNDTHRMAQANQATAFSKINTNPNKENPN